MAREVVIVSGARSAIGTYGGSLKDIAPTELAGQKNTGNKKTNTDKIRPNFLTNTFCSILILFPRPPQSARKAEGQAWLSPRSRRKGVEKRLIYN